MCGPGWFPCDGPARGQGGRSKTRRGLGRSTLPIWERRPIRLADGAAKCVSGWRAINRARAAKSNAPLWRRLRGFESFDRLLLLGRELGYEAAVVDVDAVGGGADFG